MRIALFCALLCPVAAAQDADEEKRFWTQSPETQKSQVQPGKGDEVQATAESGPAIPDGAFDEGPNPSWVWGADHDKVYTLLKQFEVDGVKSARFKASCDNVGKVMINGETVGSSSGWSEPMSGDVAKVLRNGSNDIQVRAENRGGIAGFVFKLVIETKDGKRHHVVSDASWKAKEVDKNAATAVEIVEAYGDGPWGKIFNAKPGYAGRVPQGVFETLPGFQVEKLFSVPKDELGSWVCIAFDDKGRLIASDQGGKGICRIAPAALDGSSDTSVEQLDFSKCEYQPSGAQGILYAFDSLYFSCNGGPGSGLYRARDTDGDDQFDECVKLKEFRGGGEHGPHSLRLSPDGKRIFVIAGNHTDPPFKSGEDLKNENYSSRIPTNWGEDLLLPRMWDANGHARGKLAPGGWIASTDPDGKTWELWSIGYRNPYDMAFNADGELFAYDADMEWDVGSPWYRPTRVVHATSGSEFGWRSGTGKWPTYYIDSLPPLVNIGPGSPVGVDFGYGPPLAADSEAAQKAAATVPANRDGYVFAPLKFPAKYQKALYICDWTFGTMYAIHTTPQGSTYTATKEEFVSRTPLPLTDCAAGPDGALYFTIGGRGNQSELYRVTYVGDESTEPAELTNSKFASVRSRRHELEAGHGMISRGSDDRFELLEQTDDLDKEVASGDRFLKTAIRNAAFNSELMADLFSRESLKEIIDNGVGTPNAKTIDLDIGVVVTLAKMPPEYLSGLRTDDDVKTWRSLAADVAVKNLMKVAGSELTTEQRQNFLRAASLTFLRLSEPSDDTKAALRGEIDDWFPSDDRELNRELCQVLVYLDSPTVVAKTVELMNQPPQRDDIDMGELLNRNGGYGRAIRAMIENQPDKNQVWYAFCLRVAKVGWTPELRADYYRWFGRAQKWSGGNSFQKFLQNIENEAWENTPFDHRILVEKAGARTPYKAPELPKPVGPGKAWTLEEVRSLAKTGLKGRSYENGQRTFAATRCILCHRFAGDGGATGPDLTQLAGRFNIDALTEAIMDPSKVISDQYKASSVVTSDGKVINGRIVSENDDQISVLIDPEDSTKITDVPKNNIDEILPSKVSIMPAELLKPLNKDEVLDLLAYLLSRGDQKNPMFK